MNRRCWQALLGCAPALPDFRLSVQFLIWPQVSEPITCVRERSVRRSAAMMATGPMAYAEVKPGWPSSRGSANASLAST
ncbi:hypothetical protein G6F50_018613 [Rhizopus delemar]|uniref:Uncharacterized protein n=1 Tax=Rhizopus delemar TaxID=936053 RepID=A0A9P6XM80_9FUNG|nr:hypothetical protein G6F50_018613 [Rhizopus delemar]